MKVILFIAAFLCLTTLGFGQEISRISKAGAAIQEKSKEYANAIASSNNPGSAEAVYKNKDSLLFLKDLEAFFKAFEVSIREEEGSRIFVSDNRRLEYVVLVSNTGYTDAFYYDFENKKISLSFISALNTFIANHKWENSKKAKFVHRGIYLFK